MSLIASYNGYRLKNLIRDVTKLLGERLTKLRKQKKLTQESLSKKLNIPRTTYSGYESDRREPDIDTLRKLANFFDVSLDYLTGNSDDPNPKPEKLTEKELADIKAIADGKIKLVINGEPLEPKDEKMALGIFKSIYERAKARIEEDN